MNRLLLFFAACFLGSCASYRTLHSNAQVIDTHNDVISQVVIEKHLRVEDDLTGKAHTDLKRLKKGGVDGTFFSIFCDENYGKGKAFAFANEQIDTLMNIVNRNPDKIALARTPAEFQTITKQGKIAAMIGVEGGHMIEDNLTYLDNLYKRGTRYLTLTWNNSTSWASSAADETSKPGMKKGLSDFGKQVVRRMNELGMMVDVSHNGEQTFYDVIKTTNKPVIASHSSVYSICPVPRNLKDEQIKAIAKNGGVIQINFFSGFLDSTYNSNHKKLMVKIRPVMDSLKNTGMEGEEIARLLDKKFANEIEGLRPPFSVILDHIDYIKNLVGADYVGLGGDFDGIGSTPKGVDDVTAYPLIAKGLKERGYSDADVKKIMGGNLLRVWKANEVK